MPLAGFWMRAGAFGADGLLLYLLAGFWVARAKPFFLDHPLLLPFAPALVAFAYLIVLNGPVGKGQTLGKKLMQIATRRLDGAPLGWEQSLARTVVQCFTILAILANEALLQSAEPGPQETRLRILTACLLIIPGHVYLLANVACVAMRRDKRGLHDLVCGTFSCRAAASAEAAEYIKALPPGIERRAGQATLLVALTILGVFEYNVLGAKASEMEYGAFVGDLWRAYSVKGFHVYTPRSGFVPEYKPPQGQPPADQNGGEKEQSGANGASSTANSTKPTTSITSITSIKSITSTKAAESPSSSATASGKPAPKPAPKPRIVFPVVYYHYGRVDDDALLRTIATDNLTTRVADWVFSRRDDKTIRESLDELLKAPAAPATIYVDVIFMEVLMEPWFLGPSFTRHVHESTFPFPAPASPQNAVIARHSP